MRRTAGRAHDRRILESVEQFRLAQEALGIVTWIWDIGADRVQWYGDASRLLGLPAKRFSGRFPDYLKHVHREDVAAAKATFIDCLKSRRPEYRTLERVIWPDGGTHWLETYGRAEYGPDRRAVRMTGVIKEVTERKKQESARLKAEKQLARVFDASPDYIVIVRASDGMFLAVNPAFERVTGYAAQEIIGRTVGDINLWALPGERERFLAELRSGGGSLQNRPALIRTRSGAVVSGRMSASVIEHEGERLIVSLMHDVTEAKRLERRARQSERKFAALFETSPVGLVVTRPRERRIVEINDAALRMIGLQRDEAIGAATMEAVRWLNAEEIEALRARALTGEPVTGKQVSFVRRDGRRIDAIMSAALIDLEGEPHFVISVLDVTEQRRIERARQQAESKYTALFATNPEAVVVTRLRDGLILAQNPACERHSGYRVDEVLGRSVLELRFWVSADDRTAVVAQLEATGSVSNVETRFRRADGVEIEVLVSAARVEIEGEACAIWSWRDVSDMRETERRARESERKFAALFENSPEPISLMRLSDHVRLAANSAWERVTGYSRERASSRPAAAMSMFRDPAERRALIERVARENIVTNVERRLVRADGTEFDALISGACIDIDGERCILWNWRDVSEQRRLERERRAADARFRALFETSPTGLVVTDPVERRIVEINDAALRILGVARDAAIGARPLEIVRWSDRAQIEGLRHRWLAGEHGGQPVRFERPDGKPIEAIISGVATDLGGEARFVVSLLDVTEQRRLERAQREADVRYRTLFASALEGIFIARSDNVIIDANPAACALTGYARAELVGMNAARLYSEAELRARPMRSGAQPRWSVLERALTRNDGSACVVEVVGGAMPDGNVLAILRDVTERKRNETLLMNVARGVSAELGGAFFRSLAEHLARELGADFAFIGELVAGGARIRPLAFLADGAMVPAAEHPVLGSMSEQPLAHGATVTFDRGVRERFPGNAGMQNQGVEAYVGTPLYGADGAALGVLAVGHRKPIERAQFWASMIEIFGARAAAEIERARAEALVLRTNESLEATVRERTRELEEANRELESYNYSISHDLRQPLNAIAGFADLLRDQIPKAGAAAEECVGEIESNAARMEQMIESLLRLSRAGRGALRRESVDAARMVESVMHDLSAGAPLPAEVAVGELPPAQGDPVLLRQVWANLIGNALKYSRKSAAPRIELSGRRTNGTVEYVVRDNGIGFDMQYAGRLFGAFQRLPSASGYEGTGIGLAIVERIVRRHGGTISAESAHGQGATFRFTLPA